MFLKDKQITNLDRYMRNFFANFGKEDLWNQVRANLFDNIMIFASIIVILAILFVTATKNKNLFLQVVTALLFFIMLIFKMALAIV